MAPLRLRERPPAPGLTPDDPAYYPDSDGQPMGETPTHFRNTAYLVEELRAFFAADPMVYVAGDMFIYYEKGNRRKHFSPDVFVVRGVPKVTVPERRRYLRWDEGKGPDFVLEITSASTREEDYEDKMDLYATELAAPEYFLFDPFEEYLHPRLQGYRLVAGRYQPIALVNNRLPSEVLGLHLEGQGTELRLYDPRAGRWLPTPAEVHESLKQTEAERQREAEARQQAEAEVQRLRQELEALRRQGPPPG